MTIALRRRQVLHGLGISLALPLLSSASQEARALGAARKCFIGAYFPNGAHMPHGESGSFQFDDALAPLGEFQQNAMLLRGLHNGFGGIDPHWQNCAGFLSCEPIQLVDPGVARCAKSLDQYIADAYPTPLRSLEIGGLYYHEHLLNDHPAYSNDYLNRISWQTADKYRSPVADPARLFDQLFARSDDGSAARMAFLRARKLSILDQLHGDAGRLSARLEASYRPVLESYMQTVRELELQIEAPVKSCTDNPPEPAGDFTAPNQNYVARFHLMHRMVALALKCRLSNVATIMYGPSVSDGLNFEEELGAGGGHHGYAHHGGSADRIARLKLINQVQSGLLAHLLGELKSAEMLSETLVLYGSDMSDGDIHHTENLPMVLCGAGPDLKWGQEIGSRENRRPVSDLHMDVLKLMGVVGIESFGAKECLSTGASLGLSV